MSVTEISPGLAVLYYLLHCGYYIEDGLFLLFFVGSLRNRSAKLMIEKVDLKPVSAIERILLER